MIITNTSRSNRHSKPSFTDNKDYLPRFEVHLLISFSAAQGQCLQRWSNFNQRYALSGRGRGVSTEDRSMKNRRDLPFLFFPFFLALMWTNYFLMMLIRVVEIQCHLIFSPYVDRSIALPGASYDRYQYLTNWVWRSCLVLVGSWNTSSRRWFTRHLRLIGGL